jgi:hypothetical protein
MRHFPFTIQAALILTLGVCLPSCVAHKPRTVQAAPPPPKPAAATAPAPPPEPLSILQTEVRLPPPQPVTPEAIATTVPAEEPAGTPSTPRPAPRQPRQPAPKPEVPAQSAPATAAPPAAAPEHPIIQEVTPAAEQRRLQEEANAHKREVRQLIDSLDRRRLNRQQRGTFDRIQSFLKQSDEAEGRGEMRQASELAQRALVLAHELKP